MPKLASLRNLRPWRPGQSGNPKGRPRAPGFTERDRHAILAAFAGIFDEATQRAATKPTCTTRSSLRWMHERPDALRASGSASELRVRAPEQRRSIESFLKTNVVDRAFYLLPTCTLSNMKALFLICSISGHHPQSRS
jgi:hypothetical protein